ncbi:MAG: nucleoside-diphosphate sugar epimerase/dehydratase [Oscillochloridaceae bacterium]|nr:polysaccharide biosynthesis protein [Chloroflexaceae bacterium]MDW8389244.1 nucleoside-diphosphate sugar epimerase/dehydratase [Oscillochloridaceae bacterium]
MISAIRNRYLLGADLLLLPLAAYSSFVLRLEQLDLGQFVAGFFLFVALVAPLTILLFWLSGSYARYWRYASSQEFLTLYAALTIATLLIGALLSFQRAISGTALVPFSIPFLFVVLAAGLITLPRLSIGLFYNLRSRRASASGVPQRVLIMGAGGAGAHLARQLRDHPEFGLQVIGFLDDDPLKHHMHIHGVPVLGSHQAIPEIARATGASAVIIAISGLPGRKVRAIVSLCESVGLRTKIIPGLHDLLDSRVSFTQIRDVQIEDLLRREPIATDTTAVRQLLHGRRVLVTGGGGSIGSELCRQILACNPAELVVLGHGENSVFEIHHELLRRVAALPADGPRPRIHPVIADIREPDRLDEVFAAHRPEVVFHAAAHKHVPLMECNIREAFSNNVFGTRNVLNAAERYEVDRLVMISTDKAVNPTSIMGVSKRVAELLVHQTAKRCRRPYVAVRFGNVLGSRGSVLHTFKKQIAAGGPVTVTHPEMRRFFMTIPEAVQLVLQAAVLGRGGEVFTLDMGEPIKIVDLARDMIELSGLQVGEDIEIVFTGLRPGEKLYEELFVPGEEYRRTSHAKIFIAANASSLVPQNLDALVNALERATLRGDRSAMLAAVQELVPNHCLEQAIPPVQPVAATHPLIARAVGD